MSSDILDKHIVALGLSAQWSGLDIDDIPTSQIEKQHYQFWCKYGGKSPNFGLCACPQLKYCPILYLILEKSLLLVKKKKAFSAHLNIA